MKGRPEIIEDRRNVGTVTGEPILETEAPGPHRQNGTVPESDDLMLTDSLGHIVLGVEIALGHARIAIGDVPLIEIGINIEIDPGIPNVLVVEETVAMTGLPMNVNGTGESETNDVLTGIEVHQGGTGIEIEGAHQDHATIEMTGMGIVGRITIISGIASSTGEQIYIKMFTVY